ncbi:MULTISPECIES: sodium:solute symporter family protein [unclassified Prochlorococcus]|uniref:sodium:solute symporter family protein n=1 Tax=unclassified Prochlorococcus TaxID=2627481 RepID=UPI0005339AE1|nr:MULTISPECIES: sodium:solute symporter family protein [unclassified Prochlorococcus]KGG14757.1 putative sodium-solute symporter [Prochlorococcus sp. MIT 0602]KGG15812.1 putative sodium-solute symporter [Prochlorococcus sp. MIT 0603]
MSLIDWLILFIYLLASVSLGLFLARRNRNEDDYFVAGRSLTGWLAGASMAATTFSIDTPLYVAGLVGTRGLAGNWEWWSFGLAHVAMTVIFAPMWRRSGVLTDAAFTELRYGGSVAALLRGTKAFLLAIPINCIGIGYAFLALKKVAEALEIVDGHQIYGFVSDTLLLLFVVALFMLIYTVLGGLWAVVVNDFVQLVLALLGAFALAFAVIRASGGMSQMLSSLQELDRPELLSFFPWVWTEDGFQWIGRAGISTATFTAFLSLQWWSFRRSDGGGEFIQRLLATKDEHQAELAGWIFLVVNYLLRSWLWIVVGLAALILLPSQQDWELSYPKLAIDYLPPIILGIVVVSLVAAFMSTVSTSLNWGSSYLTHDLYQRFLRPQASHQELLLVGQGTCLLLLSIGIITALFSESIGAIFRLVIAMGTGPGVVLVLRWFWWRINAAAELAAMICGFFIGFTTSVVPLLRIDDYGIKLMFTTVITAIVWLIALWITPPESEEVLEGFVRLVRPPGPGWEHLRKRFGVTPVHSLQNLIMRFMLSVGVLFGLLFATGGFLLHQQITAWLGLSCAVLSFLVMKRNFFKRSF